MKRVVPGLFVSLWCRKCKKREEHVMTESENPGKSNNTSAALIFECQGCGEKKKVCLLEFT